MSFKPLAESPQESKLSLLANHEGGRLPPEIEQGNIEYKLKLVNPSPERLENLITQLKWRLAEGSGECLYEIGVSDKGNLVGLCEGDMEASIKTLRMMGSKLSAELFVVREKKVENGRMIREILFRKCLDDEQHFLEIRVAILGAADAGKSSFLGVLCYEELDSGKGLARLNLLRHLHEIKTGRSSAISMEIIGYGADGKLINYASSRVLTWENIVERAAKVVTFMDTCGHPKYQKTTIGGLSGNAPDYACLIISANSGGLPAVARVPLMICITKIDISTSSQLTLTLNELVDFLKSPGVSKMPVVIQTEDDVTLSIPVFIKSQIVPLFLISNVTGENLNLLKKLFNLLPKQDSFAESIDKELEFHIQDTYQVNGMNIVGGLMQSGAVRISSTIHSPVMCYLGPDQGRFIPVLVKSIRRQRCVVRHLQAGQAGTIGLQFLDPETYTTWKQDGKLVQGQDSWVNSIPDNFKLRRGQILTLYSDGDQPRSYFELELDLVVVSHPTFLQSGQDLTAHCGSISQSVRITDISIIPADVTSVTPSSQQRRLENVSPVDPLTLISISKSLPSPDAVVPTRSKKRLRTSSGIVLKQGERGRVRIRFLNEPETIGRQSSIILRGPEVKCLAKII